LDAAVEEFERAAAAAPGDVDAHLALGRACLRAGQIDKADQALSRAADIEPVGQDRLKFQIADALLENGRPDRAADIFTDLLDHRPQNPVLLNRMGVVRRRQGDHRKALEYYKRALELTPNDEHLLFNMGRCHYELGHKERAAEFLNQALAIAPDFEAARHLLDRVS
jgi:tetratricopeptide (TPR) repeat protein